MQSFLALQSENIACTVGLQMLFLLNSLACTTILNFFHLVLPYTYFLLLSKTNFSFGTLLLFNLLQAISDCIQLSSQDLVTKDVFKRVCYDAENSLLKKKHGLCYIS